jgi:uncharacterized RDD family membrane protein YckC
MSDTLDPRFAPPQAHVADLATDEIVLAERGTRLLAAIVDGLIVGGAVWAVGQIPAVGAIFKDSVEAGSMTSFNPLSMLLGFGLFLIIQAWPLLTRGQTVGKILFKLRIVRSDGSKPEAWRLLGLRYGIGFLMNLNVISSMIYGLLDCLLIFRASRKCLHDSIADTQVIKL